MKSRASSKCWQKVTNKDWRESFQELDRITALVPGKPEVVLLSFSFTSAIRFLRAYGGHIAMYSRAWAVALSAVSGHDYNQHGFTRSQLILSWSVFLSTTRCRRLFPMFHSFISSPYSNASICVTDVRGKTRKSLEFRSPPLFLIPSHHPTPTSIFIPIPFAQVHVAPAHSQVLSIELRSDTALNCFKWFTREDKGKRLLKQE